MSSTTSDHLPRKLMVWISIIFIITVVAAFFAGRFWNCASSDEETSSQQVVDYSKTFELSQSELKQLEKMAINGNEDAVTMLFNYYYAIESDEESAMGWLHLSAQRAKFWGRATVSPLKI